MSAQPSVGAIIVAAGSSSRMSGVDKLWIDLQGEPLLARTIEAIARTPGLSELVVAASPEAALRAAAHRHLPCMSRVHRWVPGGETRQDSVFHALQTLQPCDIVLVHDGARPLITADVLQRGIDGALVHGAVIAAVPMTDTVKVVDEREGITATLDRRALRAAQTPQAFRYDLLCEAYNRVGAARARCTDDGGVAEMAGMPVFTFLGEATNIKVSTVADIGIVRALWTLLREGAAD